ncbi:MAG: PAS domain-containing protein, partial [Eudoraea sp.]|nr:PAS domain-containing protein [Eudoraea sp.]
MESLHPNYLIKDAPFAVALLDKSLHFKGHSEAWVSEFANTDAEIIGKHYYDVMPFVPESFKLKINEGLNGIPSFSKGEKLITPDDRILWLKWKIIPWIDINGNFSGLIIMLEDITIRKREEELLLTAERVGKIGGWEVDLINNKVYWTQITREIHEVPEDYIPNLEEGINFYKAGDSRDRITELVSDAIANGKSWDTQLQLVTAKGNEIWVHAKGASEMINGKCIRLYGTFQDINKQKKTEIQFKEATERLAIATKGAGVGIWDYDIVENNLIWDDNMYRLYGVNKADFA